MEQAQARPMKKRRRWLIVALLLVLVSGVAWWEWPKRDPRLFGSWSVTRDDQTQPFGEYEFGADGTYQYRDLTTGRVQRVALWYVADGKVYCGVGIPGSAGRIFRNMSGLLNRQFGYDVFQSALPLTIDSVEDETVVLHSEDRVVRLTLRRIPE